MTKNSYGSLETGTENEQSLRMTGQTGNDEGVKGVKKETSRKVVRKNNRNTNRKPVGIRKKVADPRNIPLPEEDTVKIDTTRKGQTANKSAKAGKNAKAVPAEKVKNPDVNKREAKRSQRSENSGKRSKPGDSRQKLSPRERILILLRGSRKRILKRYARRVRSPVPIPKAEQRQIQKSE